MENIAVVVAVVAFGVGYGLTENMVIEDGFVKNPSFRDYKLMTAPEAPDIELHFIENGDPEGPFGAKGIAELPTIIPAPAIANAVYNAIGVRFNNPPITPEKVVRAIMENAGQKIAAE